MDRVLEPEYMDTVEEANDYDAMDHSGPNGAFVERLIALGARGRMLDLGTGPAHIPILLVRKLAERGDSTSTVVAVDAAATMLAVAERRVREAELGARITLERADAKGLPHATGAFDAVFSNTILHHIPDPLPFLREAARVLRPGGVLLIRDLFRPADAVRRDALVELYARDATPAQKELFRASLGAALTVSELEAVVRELGLAGVEVVVDTDRHMSLQTARPRLSLARPSPRELRDAREEPPPRVADVPPESSLVGKPLLPTAMGRPSRWRRRSGPADAEAKKLERSLVRVERAIDGGAARSDVLAMLAELPRGPFHDSAFHVRLGDAFYDAQQWAEAELHYRSALLRDPTHADTLHRLGLVYDATERPREMVEVWLQVRKLDRNAPASPWSVTEDELAEITETTLARLPAKLRSRLSNLPLVVSDLPSEELVRDGLDPRVLGVITGVPLSEKASIGEGTAQLDCVYLFQRNIERIAQSPDMVREEIAKTVVHEVLHYFGLSEAELERWGLA